MSGERRINYIQSPLVPLNEFRNLVTDHLAILLATEQEFPEHHTTWSECFNSTNGVPNQFRGFNSLHDAQQYLFLPA